MRLLVDVQSLQTGSRFRGIGRYTFSLVKELAAARSEIEMLLLVNDQSTHLGNGTAQKEELDAIFGTNRTAAFPVPSGFNYARDDEDTLELAEAVRGEFIAALDPDVVLLTSLFETEAVTSVPTIHARKYRAATILYDLIPLSEPERYLPTESLRGWYDRKLSQLRNSDLILAISEHSRQDAISRLGIPARSCFNIGGASDMPAFQIDSGRRLGEIGVPDQFILYVGGFEHRKNVANLLEAYARLDPALRQQYPLVLAGRVHPHEQAHLMSKISELALSEDSIVFPGFVSDDSLGTLYRNCRAFVFPSSNEGFGLPPLEAMTFGAPTIAARRASLAEVVGNEDALFEPDDIPAFALLLEKTLTDDAFRQGLITFAARQVTKFSWKNSAKAAMEHICNLAQQPMVHAANSYSSRSLLRGCVVGSPLQIDDSTLELRADLVARACSSVERLISSGIAFDKPGALNLKTTFRDSIPDHSGVNSPFVFSSTLCREQHFRMPLYAYWCNQFKETPKLHRKQWEYVYICQVLHERGLLQHGRRAIGFGVGKEPLPAFFASQGIRVLATDQDIESARKSGWVHTNQHSTDVSSLNDRGICDPATMAANTEFRNVDMNAIPKDLGGFDFCWSSCAFEHLGSISRGLQFVLNSAKLLKPGGICIHTTEYNVFSNDDTIDDNPSFVIFRRRDIEHLATMLNQAGFVVEPIDFWPGEDQLEQYIDLPPYLDEPHLRLELAGRFVSTSIGLIVRAPTR